jgi:hypothetical protein
MRNGNEVGPSQYSEMTKKDSYFGVRIGLRGITKEGDVHKIISFCIRIGQGIMPLEVGGALRSGLEA